jgi:hypothetical protein
VLHILFYPFNPPLAPIKGTPASPLSTASWATLGLAHPFSSSHGDELDSPPLPFTVASLYPSSRRPISTSVRTHIGSSPPPPFPSPRWAPVARGSCTLNAVRCATRQWPRSTKDRVPRGPPSRGLSSGDFHFKNSSFYLLNPWKLALKPLSYFDNSDSAPVFVFYLYI